MERSAHWGVKHTGTHQGGGSTPSMVRPYHWGGVPPHWQNFEPEHIYVDIYYVYYHVYVISYMYENSIDMLYAGGARFIRDVDR